MVIFYVMGEFMRTRLSDVADSRLGEGATTLTTISTATFYFTSGTFDIYVQIRISI